MESIEVVKVILDNFRSIKHREFDLRKRTAFIGENKKGKSATLEGIYWCLTGKQPDGGADFQSFKPRTDSSANVSVTLVLSNGTTIKREYQEQWTKSKGSNNLKLDGHVNRYYIDDVKIPTQTAFEAELKRIFRINNIGEISSPEVDVAQLLINPKYFSSILDMKERRRLLIDLIGDVSVEEVVNNNEQLQNLQNYFTNIQSIDSLKKATAQQISSLKKQIDSKNIVIDELSKHEHPSEEEYNTALNELKAIDDQLWKLDNSNNPNKELIDNKYKRIAECEQKISEQNASIAKSRQEASEKQSALRRRQSNLKIELSNLRHEADLAEYIVGAVATKKHDLLNKMKELRANIELLNNQKVNADDIIIECEHCHEIANETTYKETLSKREHARMEEIENLKLKGKELRAKFDSADGEVKKYRPDVEIQQDIDRITEEIEGLEKQIKECIDEYNDIKVDDSLELIISNLRNEISQLEKPDTEISDLGKELKVAKSAVMKIIDGWNAWRSYQSDIEKLNEEVDILNSSLTRHEEILIACDLFMNTRYKILAEKASALFKGIEFELIKKNIKEDSWNEVCYVLVGVNKVPFASGSTTEQITAGISIIEVIKKRLNLPDLPIIFDEGEAFTKSSIEQLTTESQTIVAQPVSDIPDITVSTWGENL